MQQSIFNPALNNLSTLGQLQLAWKPCGEMCRNNCMNCDHNTDELFGDADYCKDCHNYSKWESSVHKYCERCGRPRTEEAWVELIEHIKKLGINEWVSVEDCLPEESQEVKKFSEPDFEMCSVIACGKTVGGCGQIVKETNRFVYHKTKDEFTNRFIESGGHEFDKWYWADGWECVTHWMPLPRLPVWVLPDILDGKG